MYDCTAFYIDGEWRKNPDAVVHDIINPATEQPVGKVAYGVHEDVDRAVSSAREAFSSYSRWTLKERLDLLDAIAATYKTRWDDIAAAITAEMGAPAEFSKRSQTGSGLAHLRATMNARPMSANARLVSWNSPPKVRETPGCCRGTSAKRAARAWLTKTELVIFSSTSA